MSLLPVNDPTESYWLSEPHPLARFRSSTSVPESVDVAVIGAGLAGVATAYHILKRCHDTGKKPPSLTVIEARQTCSGATGRNGGHVKFGSTSLKSWHAKYGPEGMAQLVGWVAAQRKAFKKIADTERLECELLMSRSYDVFFDQDVAASVKQFLDEHRGEEALEEIQWLEGPHLEKVTGVKGAFGAVNIPVVSLWPYKFVTGLLARVVEMGASLYTETPVESIEYDKETGNSKLGTPRGTTTAAKVVFATNGYSCAISPEYRDVIVPVRGQAAHLVPKKGSSGVNLTATYNLHYSSKAVDYLNPRPDDSIVLGGGYRSFRKDLQDRNDKWFNTVDDSSLIDDGVVRDFDSKMASYFRGWEDRGATVDQTWTGIMGSTMDQVPHVGAVPGKTGQWILAGFNGGGMAMILTTAQGVADMVVNGTTYSESGMPGMFETTRQRLDDARFGLSG